MEITDIIASAVGGTGFVTAIVGIILATRANGLAKRSNLLANEANKIAAQAVADARSTTQDFYRTQARGVMREALIAAGRAFDESGRDHGDQPSPRATLSDSATQLREVAECLDNATERSALENLADRYQELSGETAKMDQVRDQADSAPPEAYIGEADDHRLASVHAAETRWHEVDRELRKAQRTAQSAMASGTRNKVRVPQDAPTPAPHERELDEEQRAVLSTLVTDLRADQVPQDAPDLPSQANAGAHRSK